MRASRVILAGMVLCLPVVLGSCATMSKEECVAADWRVVGETDGAAGHDPQSRFAAHAKSCEKAGVVPDQSLWYQGFQVGVTRYCTPLNGLQEGRAGKSYHNVCPAASSDGFLRGYRLGKAEHEQRRKIQSFDSEIRQVEFRIAELQKKIGEGSIDQNEAEREIGRLRLQIHRIRFDKQRAELDLRTIERDGEIFAANPDMVIPPRYSY